eukprot:scaffold26359_cov122-Cylindrotheca_fusiformis.AAC.1
MEDGKKRPCSRAVVLEPAARRIVAAKRDLMSFIVFVGVGIGIRSSPIRWYIIYVRMGKARSFGADWKVAKRISIENFSISYKHDWDAGRTSFASPEFPRRAVG